MDKPLHVIFGAGQVGRGLAHALRDAGQQVRVVRRSGAPVGDGIEVVAADAMDARQARDAADGASVIYHCMNPTSYSEEAWREQLPRMGEALIGAALAADARLVCLDNVYAYGPMDGPRRPDSPMQPDGAKARVRAEWDAQLRKAEREHGLRWTAVRGGDFFGPGTSDQSLMSMSTVDGIGQGRPALLIGQPRQPHSFSFVPDVVNALVALGTAASDVEGQAWHAPVHTLPPRELVQRLAAAHGRTGWAVTLPAWLIRALSPLVPLFRDLRETLYQWERPFYIDDSAFKARFPEVGVSTDAAVQQTVRASVAA